MPGGEARMLLAPGQIGEAEIEIAERDADPDVPDIERRCREIVRFFLEHGEAGDALCREGREMDLGLLVLRTIELVAPEERVVEHAVAERLAPQRDDARLGIGR